MEALTMNERFQKIIDTFPTLMDRLNNSPFITKNEFSNVPKKGIYVFYENNLPIYVGRTNRMRNRLKEHCQQSSGHESATFAFNLAKEKAKDTLINLSQRRKDLQKDPLFSRIYTEEKERVSIMKIKVIEIEDPIVQTLFEVYAHLELKTKNDFKTH
jgi:hypothetical protein